MTVVLLGVVFRRRLRGRYEVPTPFAVEDRGLLVVAGVVCAGLGPAFVLGADVTVAAVIGALVLVIACLVRRPRLVGWRLLPWPLVLGVSVLFVLVEIAHAYGLSTLVGELVGQGDGWVALLRLAGVSALAANLLNNLPAYLAVEPSALDSPRPSRGPAGGGERGPTDHAVGESGDVVVGGPLPGGRTPGVLAAVRRTGRGAGPVVPAGRDRGPGPQPVTGPQRVGLLSR